MTCPIPLETLSPAARRAADPSSPAPARMMAARGMVPMPPKDLVTAQYVLTFDPDTKVSEAAVKSLSNLDARLSNAILGDTSINEYVLGYLAAALVSRDADVEKLLLNASTPNWAVQEVAAVCSEHVCEIIANNQARVLAYPDITRGLLANPKCLKSTSDRVIDFLVRSNVILDGIAEFEHALLRLTGEERVKAVEAIEVPKELLDEQYLSDEDRRELATERRLILDTDDESPESEEKEKPKLEQLLKDMTTGQKVALATKGNKAVRTRLVRDTNRIVAMAAITSPGITENEVSTAANSRTVHQDVIGYIARNKEYVKLYPVKVALVNNPKTPLPEAMKLVPYLQKKDQKTVSTSKNVSAAVRNLALKLVKGGG